MCQKRENLFFRAAVWSASPNNDNVRVVDKNGDKNWNNPNKRNLAARPDLLLKRNEKIVIGKATMFL